MKLVYVIGTLLVIAGIQMSASEDFGLEWDKRSERSESPTLSELSVDSDSQEPGMDSYSFSSLGVGLGSLQKEQSHALVTFDETLKSLNDFADGYDQGFFNMKDLLPLPERSTYEKWDKQIKDWVKFLDENQGKITDSEGLRATLDNCQRELEELGKFKFYGFETEAAATQQPLGQLERDRAKEQFEANRQASLARDRRVERLGKLIVGGTIATLAVVAAVIWYYYKKPAAAVR